ncbi:hypothetical protein Tco_0601330 [Tanacetum coccineum]
MGTMWRLCDLTPSGWCKTDAHSTDFGKSISEAWTRFKGLLQKVPHHAGSKLHDKNAKESWTLLEDLAIYDNESWNDPRDFAKPVKAISLPQDVPTTSDYHLIEFENQVQCLMEAHLAPKSSVQVNKIASSCKIYSSPHDTQYCIEIPKIAFVDYTSSHHLERSFQASFEDLKPREQDTRRTSRNTTRNDPFPPFLLLEAQTQAINVRMMGALPSDTVKNSKLNANHTSSVSSARSYPMEDLQCSSHIHNSINAINMCSKQANEFQKYQPEVKTLAVNEIGTPKSKEPEQILEDEFKDLHLNLPVLEVLAHALMYNAILDKYVESLELGKSGSAFIQGKMPKKIKDYGLFTLPYRLGDSKPFDTLADLGSCMNLILLKIDYGVTETSCLRRNGDQDTSSFFNMESYGVMVTSWLP